ELCRNCEFEGASQNTGWDQPNACEHEREPIRLFALVLAWQVPVFYLGRKPVVSVPSCQIPTTFAAFHRQRPSLGAQSFALQPPEAPDFLKSDLSPLKAVQWFSSGFLMAFAGRWAWRNLMG